MCVKRAVSTATDQEIPDTTETQSRFQKQKKDCSHDTFQHAKEWKHATVNNIE